MDIQINWYVSNVWVYGNATTLAPGNFTVGNTLIVQVSVSDGTDNVSSNSTGKMVYTPPSVSIVTIIPSQIDTDSPANVTYSYTSGGLPDVQINWYVNSAWVYGNATSLGYGNYTLGSTITVQVSVSDGTDNALLTSAGTVVQAMPTMTGVSIIPTQVDTDSAANVTYSYTGSGTLDIQINWYVGGNWVYGNATSLAHGNFTLGASITVQVSVSDGTDNASSLSTAKIVQAVPTVSGVSIIPSQVDTDSAANVTYSYTGSGTLDIQINWYVGGNWVYGNATSLAHGNFTLGASITVQVSVSDGTDNVSQTSGAKIVQAVPTVSGVSIIPSQIDTDTAANVTYSYTGSGTLDIQINWYVGGNWIYGNATSLAYGNFTLGASITVQVSVSDGTDNASQTSGAKIVQAVPTVSGVSIIPNQIDTDTAANVTYSYTGSGTLDIQINWYVSGNWVYGNATSLAHGNFTLGASITVEVSVSDGTDNVSQTSGANFVQAVPTVSGVSIIPSQIDTDTAANVTYSYTGSGTLDIQINWYVGGNWIYGNATSLAYGNFTLGASITVQVSVSDGTDNASQTSGGKIVQAVPTVSGISIIPNQIDTDTAANVSIFLYRQRNA